MTGATSTCPGCGAEATGNFCSQCGARLAGPGDCADCGARLKQGAIYCGQCGRAVGAPPRKAAAARLPWILSALALAAFSLVIALLVQRQTAPRSEGMTMTGGIPGQPGGGQGPGTAGPAGPAGAPSSMPSAEELASMTPRERADRLFERAMREHGGTDSEQALFFVDMALQAYQAVPPSQTDADGRFHVGLLRLVRGDAAAARASAESILSEEEDHLLGLALAVRVSEMEGDPAGAEAYRDRIRAAIEAAGGLPDREEYRSHRPFIESMLAEEIP